MFWLAMVSIALLLLTLLFPQLERRDEDRPRTLSPPYVPRRQSEQPSMPAVTIVETPKTASLPRSVQTAYWSANTRLIRILLLVWGGSVLLPTLLAAELSRIRVLTGFPLSYFLVAQGAPILFLTLATLYTAIMTRRDRQLGGRHVDPSLPVADTVLPVALVIGGGTLIVVIDVAFRLPVTIIGWALIILTIVVYAAIGIRSRAQNLEAYYVAGRRIPAFFNGLAISADWMSAATFISLAGTLWMLGYEGLAYCIFKRHFRM